MFIWTFLLRIAHTIISQSIADSSWITLYVWESLSFGQYMNHNSFPHRNKKFLLFPNVSRPALGPPSLLPIGMGALPPRIWRRIVNLTTHLYLVLWLSTSLSGDTAPPSRANSLYGMKKIHIYHSPTLSSGRIFNVYNNTSKISNTYPSSRQNSQKIAKLLFSPFSIWKSPPIRMSKLLHFRWYS